MRFLGRTELAACCTVTKCRGVALLRASASCAPKAAPFRACRKTLSSESTMLTLRRLWRCLLPALTGRVWLLYATNSASARLSWGGTGTGAPHLRVKALTLLRINCHCHFSSLQFTGGSTAIALQLSTTRWNFLPSSLQSALSRTRNLTVLLHKSLCTHHSAFWQQYLRGWQGGRQSKKQARRRRRRAANQVARSTLKNMTELLCACDRCSLNPKTIFHNTIIGLESSLSR